MLLTENSNAVDDGPLLRIWCNAVDKASCC